MRLFKTLAFCSCAYVWLGVVGQYLGMAQSESLPSAVIAFRVFACLLTVCCVFALASGFWAAIISWAGALGYLSISWKVNVDWVFRDDVIRFTLWVPLFLTVAAYLERKEEAEREAGGS